MEWLLQRAMTKLPWRLQFSLTASVPAKFIFFRSSSSVLLSDSDQPSVAMPSRRWDDLLDHTASLACYSNWTPREAAMQEANHFFKSRCACHLCNHSFQLRIGRISREKGRGIFTSFFGASFVFIELTLFLFCWVMPALWRNVLFHLENTPFQEQCQLNLLVFKILKPSYPVPFKPAEFVPRSEIGVISPSRSIVGVFVWLILLWAISSTLDALPSRSSNLRSFSLNRSRTPLHQGQPVFVYRIMGHMIKYNIFCYKVGPWTKLNPWFFTIHYNHNNYSLQS